MGTFDIKPVIAAIDNNTQFTLEDNSNDKYPERVGVYQIYEGENRRVGWLAQERATVLTRMWKAGESATASSIHQQKTP